MMLYVSDNVKRMDIVDQLSEGFKKTYDWLTSPIGKLPDAPQATTHTGKVLAGVYEGVKPAVEAVESPLGIGLAGLAAWKPQLAARFAQAYAPVGAYGAFKELEGIDPSKQDAQEIARRISSGFVQGLGSVAGIKAGAPKYLDSKKQSGSLINLMSPEKREQFIQQQQAAKERASENYSKLSEIIPSLSSKIKDRIEERIDNAFADGEKIDQTEALMRIMEDSELIPELEGEHKIESRKILDQLGFYDKLSKEQLDKITSTSKKKKYDFKKDGVYYRGKGSFRYLFDPSSHE